MSILAAVDGERVPSRPVEVGYELAQQYDTELVVLHVMTEDVFDRFQDTTKERESVSFFAPEISYRDRNTRGSDTPGEPNQFTIQTGEAHAAGVAEDVVLETLEERRNVTYQGRVGNPSEEIVGEADRRDAKHVVIGGRKRTPIGKAMFGSVTQSVLLSTDRPVTTVMHGE
jgi:nucleotide-binding universal stress UspA family protein